MNGVCDCGYKGKLKMERFCPKCHRKPKMRMAGEIKGNVVKTRNGIEIRGDKSENSDSGVQGEDNPVPEGDKAEPVPSVREEDTKL